MDSTTKPRPESMLRAARPWSERAMLGEPANLRAEMHDQRQLVPTSVEPWRWLCPLKCLVWLTALNLCQFRPGCPEHLSAHGFFTARIQLKLLWHNVFQSATAHRCSPDTERLGSYS